MEKEKSEQKRFEILFVVNQKDGKSLIIDSSPNIFMVLDLGVDDLNLLLRSKRDRNEVDSLNCSLPKVVGLYKCDFVVEEKNQEEHFWIENLKSLHSFSWRVNPEFRKVAIIKVSYLFPNNSVATFGWDDKQMPEFQGVYSEELEKRIRVNSDENTQFHGFKTPSYTMVVPEGGFKKEKAVFGHNESD